MICKILKKIIKLIDKMKNIEIKSTNANLLLLRELHSEESIIGKLYLNGIFYGCVEKRAGEQSPKFKYEHLWIKDVPNRSYILFHIGNYPKNTKGCILIGNTKSKNAIGQSTKAFKKLMYDLQPYEKIKLIIK